MNTLAPPGAIELLQAAALSLSRFRHQIPESVRDELRQESVTRALSRRGVQDPIAFVCRVARHLAIDWLRRRYEVGMPDILEQMPGAPWLEQVEEHIELGRLRLALAEAPAPYREIVEALLFQGADLDDLVRDELLTRNQPLTEESWALARDALYKRRTRALNWLRARLTCPPERAEVRQKR